MLELKKIKKGLKIHLRKLNQTLTSQSQLSQSQLRSLKDSGYDHLVKEVKEKKKSKEKKDEKDNDN